MRIIINNNEFDNTLSAQLNDTLNDINKLEFNVSATDNFDKTLLSIRNEVELIKDNGKRYVFKIINRALTKQNAIKCVCRGIEEISAINDVDIQDLPNATNVRVREATYVNVNAQTIFNDLINQLPNNWSLQSSITDTINNYRVNDSMSIWNAISKLCNERAYEIDIDYDNKEFIIEQNLGTPQVAVLNENIDFQGIPIFTEERARGKRVIVFGKGDGEFQARATAQDSGWTKEEPTIKIYDSNITSDSEAQVRADNELNRLGNDIKHYTIPDLVSDVNLNLSDTILLNSQSIGLENEELKIVRLITDKVGNDVYESIEVTNAEYSRAYKSSTQQIAEQNAQLRENNLNMQGSGNTLSWNDSINANNQFPLRNVFFIPEKYVDDGSGGVRILDFEVDYEINPFREGAGTATEEEVAPDFRTNSVTANHNHDVIDNGHNHFIQSQTSGNTQLSFNETVTSVNAFIINNSWVTVASRNYTRNYELLFFNIFLQKFGGDNSRIWVRIRRGSTVYYQDELYNSIEIGGNAPALDFIRKTITLNTFPLNTNGVTYFVDLIATNFLPDFDCDVQVRFDGLVREHSHEVNSITSNQGNANTDEQNRELGLFGGVQDHKHNVQVGAGIGEASSVNATGVSLFLDYWDGTTWIEKHNVSNISGIINQNIDISNNGEFPDVAGYWRVRTLTNSSDTDFVQNIVRLKHNLNN